jgi:hypothetical protein
MIIRSIPTQKNVFQDWLYRLQADISKAFFLVKSCPSFSRKDRNKTDPARGAPSQHGYNLSFLFFQQFKNLL